MQVFALRLLNTRPELAWREEGWEVCSVPFLLPAVIKQTRIINLAFHWIREQLKICWYTLWTELCPSCRECFYSPESGKSWADTLYVLS